MKRTLRVSLWAMSFVAAILFAMLIAPARVSAQDPFDVKASSATDNNAAGEFPLSYRIEYDNGMTQEIQADGEGVKNYTTPAPGASPVAIWYLNVRYVVQSRTTLCLPRNPANGGCWCLCLQWVRVWPWWVVPRWWWYWNPCC